MKRILLCAIGLASAFAMHTASAKDSTSVELVLASPPWILVDRFAADRVSFAYLVDFASELQPIEAPAVDTKADKVAVRVATYMARGEQLYAPRDNPAIGARRPATQ